MVGPVASGKSFLLQTILGEKQHGANADEADKTAVQAPPVVGYVPQEPFILQATLRDNIVFGLVRAVVLFFAALIAPVSCTKQPFNQVHRVRASRCILN